MVFRWLFRAVALFLGRKAWEAYQQRNNRSAGPRRR